MSGYHHSRSRGGFIEHTIDGLRAAMDRALYADQASGGGGLLQRLDPRVKVAGLSGLILASALAGKLWVVAGVLVFATILGMLSRLSLWALATRVWFATLTFSVILALPALFLTPGNVIYQLPVLHWGATAQGLTTASFLVLRAEAAATLALVLVFTTPWMHVLKALRMCRVPVVFVVILGMACRYILLLLETAHEMFESRKSRTVGSLTRSEQRRVAILSTGALLSRTLQLSNEVYLAMQARGFRGEVYILDDFQMRSLDWLALLTFGGLTAGLAWVGR
jgi:cobalt/nickel transport system permease protein